jgi:ubiquinone/menaquinone biosynthesis C-methylase UbiE
MEEKSKKKSKDAKKFTEHYKQKKVTGTYDAQREKNQYRQQKRKRELKYFLELLDKKNNENVLELGCSSGFLTKHLGEVTAIDTSEGMLEIAHSKNNKAKCVPGDMFDIPFKENTFDKIITMRVWNHLDRQDMKKAISEAKRVLKKGGYLIFDIEEKNFFRKIAAIIYQTITRITGYKIYQYSFKEIRQMLSQQGFKVEKIKYLNHKIGRQIILRNKLIK